MRSSRRWLGACALLILAACSKDKDVDQPTKLTDINATIKAERVWTASVADKGAKPLRLASVCRSMAIGSMRPGVKVRLRHSTFNPDARCGVPKPSWLCRAAPAQARGWS